MGYTKQTPPCSPAAQGNGSTFPTVTDSNRNTTQDWRNAGTKSPAEVLAKSPTKNPVSPNEVKNPQ